MITQEELKKQLHYDPDTGVFTWLCDKNNGPLVGNVAGGRKRSYINITVNGQPYLAHKLAFLYMKGYIPNEIDHDDRVGSNNKWLNLKESTRSQNCFNRKIPSHNKSGVKGVHWSKAHNKWIAKLYLNNKQIFLGGFKDKVDAIQARKDAEIEYGITC